MINPLEELADSFAIINYNIRELLFKLYIWNTTSDATVIFNLRTKDNPFRETFTISSRNAISTSIQSSWLNPRRLTPVVKNWGRYTTNSELRSQIVLVKSTSPDVNYLCYDGDFDGEGVVQFKLSNDNALNGDMFEFVSTIAVPFDFSNNKLIEFLDGTGNVILGYGNAPVSQFADQFLNDPVAPTTGTGKEKLTYKASFQYIVNESTGVGQWVVFDFNLFPNFQYDATSSEPVFGKYILYKDPTIQ